MEMTSSQNKNVCKLLANWSVSMHTAQVVNITLFRAMYSIYF
jgi:hypothetical protein